MDLVLKCVMAILHKTDMVLVMHQNHGYTGTKPLAEALLLSSMNPHHLPKAENTFLVSVLAFYTSINTAVQTCGDKIQDLMLQSIVRISIFPCFDLNMFQCFDSGEGGDGHACPEQGHISMASL